MALVAGELAAVMQLPALQAAPCTLAPGLQSLNSPHRLPPPCRGRLAGFRALLAMLEAGWIAGSARGLSAALAEDRLTDPLGQSVLAAGPVAALWRSCTVHARRPHVQAVCCELSILSAICNERCLSTIAKWT